MTGESYFPTLSEDMGLYVLTNKDNAFGASAILDKKALEEISERCGVDTYFVIPSAAHEMILIADRGQEDIETISKMVREINATVVAEVDRLTDTAYKIVA